MEYFTGLFKKIFLDISTVKIVGTYILVLTTFFFDTTKQAALLGLFVLIIFDFITGVYAAKKNKELIRSAKIRRTAVKIAVYFMLVSAGFIAEKSISWLPIDETILTFLVLTELKSLLENAGKMGYAVPKKLIEKLDQFKNNQ